MPPRRARIVRRTPVLLVACAWIGCISHFKGAHVRPEHASALRQPGHARPFVLQAGEGTIQVGPETRMRIQTPAGWSGWIDLRELRVYEGGVYLRREVPLEAVGVIRIENPTADLIFALQNICHLRGPCFASMSVFTGPARAPELVVPLYSTCISSDETHLQVDLIASPSPLFSSSLSGNACGWVKPDASRSSIADRACKAGAPCPDRAWLGLGSPARKIAVQRVSVIELRESSPFGRGLGEQVEWFVEIGSRMRAGRWTFFSNDDPSSSVAVFEVRSWMGASFLSRRSLPPGLLNDLQTWPVRDHLRGVARRTDSLTSIRIDHPSSELLHVLRAICRSERDKSPAICAAPLWLHRAWQKAEEVQGDPDEIEQTTLKGLSSPLDAAGRLRNVVAEELAAIELSELSTSLLRDLVSEVLIPERTADQWIIYSHRPVPTTSFDASAGQLPAQVAGLQLVQTATVPWESIVQFEFEEPGALGACGHPR